MAEQLIRNHQAVGSIPIPGSSENNNLQVKKNGSSTFDVELP
jgi:hypothetical protein